jgi:DNA-binding GntR family transcriptional regulator
MAKGARRSAAPPAGPAQPRYRQIADDLVQKVKAGTYPLGTMLPPEVDLSSRYRVSRYTVREALRQLEGMGLLSRRQGAGTTVIAREPPERFVQQIADFGELLQYPASTRLAVLSTEMLAADEALAERLQCAPGEAWLRIDGVRRMKATAAPFCLSTIYLRPEYADVVEEIGAEPGSVFTLVERRFGVRISRVDLDLEAVPVPEAAAALLEVEPGSPALLTLRRYRDEQGRVFELSESCHPASRFTYRLALSRNT